MEIQHIVVAGTVIFLAGTAQSAVGFGYALFATPLLVWIGMPLQNVITLVATCSMFQAVIGARKLRADVPWRLSLVAVAVRILSLIAGLLLLKRLATLNTYYIRATIGCILCLLVTVQFLWRPRPVKTMHWFWGGLAFLASGLLAGVSGMGGPPLVLWAMAHEWSTHRTRGFLFAVFSISIPFQIILLYVTFGSSILWSTAIGIAFLPLVYFGTVVGLPVGNRMAKDRLRRIAYAILLVVGISAVLPVILIQLK